MYSVRLAIVLDRLGNLFNITVDEREKIEVQKLIFKLEWILLDYIDNDFVDYGMECEVKKLIVDFPFLSIDAEKTAQSAIGILEKIYLWVVNKISELQGSPPRRYIDDAEEFRARMRFALFSPDSFLPNDSYKDEKYYNNTK